MKALAEAVRSMFHPHQGGDGRDDLCGFCGVRHDRAIHDHRTAGGHGFAWPEVSPLPTLLPHGERGRYQRGCRCVDCRAAEAAYVRERRHAAAAARADSEPEQ